MPGCLPSSWHSSIRNGTTIPVPNMPICHWTLTRQETRLRGISQDRKESHWLLCPVGGMAKKRGRPIRNQRTISLILFWSVSLTATIKAARPDLLKHIETRNNKRIPEDPPAQFFEKKVAHIEDVGQPSNPSFLTKTNVDPKNWYAVLICLLYWWFFLNIPFIGGYLRSMTECEDSGIP